MSGLYSVAAVVCGASVVLALLSRFVTDGGTKTLLRLVMGAFMVCCMAVPAVKAFGGVSADFDSLPDYRAESATLDEAYNRQVLAQTKENLEAALADILAQNGADIQSAEITLALTDENRVIISAIRVTVSAEQSKNAELISEVTERHFTVRPSVITE